MLANKNILDRNTCNFNEAYDFDMEYFSDEGDETNNDFPEAINVTYKFFQIFIFILCKVSYSINQVFLNQLTEFQLFA